jgi:DNA-binding transcriptional MerR regulator
MQNFLRIGDFSQLGQVSVVTLRHYDELGLLKPAQVDKFTEYRYYTLDQLPRLNRILALKDLGLSLEQIHTIINDKLSADHLRGMLEMKRIEIENKLEEEQSRLLRVEARLQQIENEDRPSPYEIVLKKVDALAVLGVRQTVLHLNDMPNIRRDALIELYAWAKENKIDPIGHEVFLYFNREYTEENIDMVTGIQIETKTLKKFKANNPFESFNLPTETMATVTHSFKIGDITPPDIIVPIFSWMGNNGFRSAGAIREWHLRWRECDICFGDSVVAEIQIPVEKN